MIYAKRQGNTVVIAAADTVEELEQTIGNIQRDRRVGESHRPDDFERLMSEDYEGFKYSPLVVTITNETDCDGFIHDHALVIVKHVALVFKINQMMEPEAVDPYSADAPDQRTLGEVYDLVTDDPWDKRTDEEKAEDEEMKRLYEEAKKDGRLSGDSFGPGKDKSVQVTDIHSSVGADGKVSIDGVMAVKGLHDDNDADRKAAEDAARAAKAPLMPGKDRVTFDPKTGDMQVNMDGLCDPVTGELDVKSFGDIFKDLFSEIGSAAPQTSTNPNASMSPGDYIYHVATMPDHNGMPRTDACFVAICERSVFESTGDFSDYAPPFEMPVGFTSEDGGPFFTYAGQVVIASAILDAMGMQKSPEFSKEMTEIIQQMLDGDDDEGSDEGSDDPEDYIFHAMPNPDPHLTASLGITESTLVVIVEKDFFDAHGCVADWHVSECLTILPPEFEEIQEGDFLFYGSIEDARRILTMLGLKESAELKAFIEEATGGPQETVTLTPPKNTGNTAVIPQTSVGSTAGHNPDILAIVGDLNARMRGNIGMPTAKTAPWKTFEVSVDADETALVSEIFVAAGLIQMDASDEALWDRFNGIKSSDDDGCKFDFRGTENELHRLLTVLNHVMGAEAFDENGNTIPFDEAKARIIDGNPQATFHRLEIKVVALGNHYPFVEVLRNVVSDHVLQGMDGDVWWIAYESRQAAERDANALDILSEITEVNGFGEKSLRRPEWERFEICIDGTADELQYQFGNDKNTAKLHPNTLAAASIISVDERDNAAVVDARWGNHQFDTTTPRRRFIFWGTLRELHRLMSTINAVTNEHVYAIRNGNEMIECDLAIAQEIDPEGIVAIYFRVDIKPSAFLEDTHMFAGVLSDSGMTEKIIMVGATPEGWWAAFMRESDAVAFTDSLDGQFAHTTIEYEVYGVNDKGERLVPKGATVVDTQAAEPEPIRPWNDRSEEYHAMTDDERVELWKGVKGSEFLYCGSYHGVQHGCVFNVVPKSWFEKNGTDWDEPLNITHLLPLDVKEVGPGLYSTKSRDWNNLSFDMARKGFRESFAFQLHLNNANL